MKKIITLLFLAISFNAYSQLNPLIQNKIDSISQSGWDKVKLDLDSLANPKFVRFDRHFKDTIVIRDEMVIANITEEIPVTPYNLLKTKDDNRWFYYGQNNLVFNQASFSNWNAGGNNNIGVIGKINYNLSYKSGNHYLENILQLGFGYVASEGQASRKTEDYINFSTNYGYDIGGNYYLSSGFQFLSQFAPGFNYTETPDPVFTDRISRFMAPGYLNAGLGISYNPNENFQAIFRPVNGKFTIVTDPHLQKAGRYGLQHDGQNIRSEIGAMLNVLYRLKIYKDIHLVNHLNFFSNYLHHPERVDISYNGALNIRFNEFISSVVSIDLLYDHDQLQKLQMKQTLGIGLSYKLGFDHKERRNKRMIKPFIAN